MSSKKTLYYLALSHFLGIGPMKFDLLIKRFKTVEKICGADIKKLKEILGITLAESFVGFRNKFNPQEKLKELERKEILVLTREDKRFPTQLKEISDPPICLYVKGDIDNFDFAREDFMAVVGTRKPTSYGQQIAYKFSNELSSSGFVIVSGMAIGIDTIAHKAALDHNGKTVAFLGCGVDIVYPPINKNLYEKIIKNGGLIISEFPPGMTVLRGLFIARNRLISGLAQGLLVVEGAKDSGALITAKYAAEQGKEVFAPPGPITSQMSAAPNILLKQGAKLVTSVDDILEEFNLTFKPIQRETLTKDLEPDEKKIFELIISEPKLADEIVLQTEMSVSAVLQILTNLEIKGIIEKNSEGRYQVRL